jgi:hypothetical protein
MSEFTFQRNNTTESVLKFGRHTFHRALKLRRHVVHGPVKLVDEGNAGKSEVGECTCRCKQRRIREDLRGGEEAEGEEGATAEVS